MQLITEEKPNSYGIVSNDEFYIAGDFYAAYEYLKGKLGTDSHPSTAAGIKEVEDKIVTEVMETPAYKKRVDTLGRAKIYEEIVTEPEDTAQVNEEDYIQEELCEECNEFVDGEELEWCMNCGEALHKACVNQHESDEGNIQNGQTTF